MIEGIDHIVILVDDLEVASAGATSAGFTVTPGGHHDQGYTQNALIAFADGTYLELLAFTAPVDPGHWSGPGFVDFALRSTDIDHDVQAIADQGLAFPIPTHLAREGQGGEVTSWRMSLPQIPEPGTAYPFLIQDLTAREIRIPSGVEATTHANGAHGIAGLTVVVHDLPAYQESLCKILQRHTPNDEASRFRSTRGVVQVPLTAGGEQSLAILQPTADSAPDRHLSRFGNGIYAVTLRRDAGDPMALGTGDLLQPSGLGEARIYLQG